MKKLLFTLGISTLLIISVGGTCGWSVYKVANDVLKNQLKIDNYKFQIFQWCTNGLPFIDQIPRVLDDKNYIIVLQNNYEIRPSGGFMGSYVVVETQRTGIGAINFQDIYVPDGQLIGHVDPPMPIQQSFQQGWWKLRDSNYDPDFNVAGEQIAWFFDQAGQKVDGVIAVNLPLASKILHIMGPVKLVDYPETITGDNLYSLAQAYAEVNFFPGSTQKRDFLGAVGKELVNNVKNISPTKALKLTKLMFGELKNHHILIWVKDPVIQNEIKFRGWDGGLGDSAGSDYLYIVDTNLSANKSNCCVNRSVNHQINDTSHNLEIVWKNESKYHNPLPPVFWGGDYNNFVRVILPEGANIKNISVNAQPIEFTKAYLWQSKIEYEKYILETRPGFTIIGFWAFAYAGESTTATINYELPTNNSAILVKRQPGLDSFQYRLTVDGIERVSKLFTNDELIDKSD
jgi:hypothetical protein